MVRRSRWPPAAKYRLPAVGHAFSLDDIYRRVCPLSIIFAHTLYEYKEATQSIGRVLLWWRDLVITPSEETCSSATFPVSEIDKRMVRADDMTGGYKCEANCR